MMPDKRLSDAELAAEKHAAVLGVYRAKVHEARGLEGALDWLLVVTRFAHAPHFDEVTE
jgi:hypothetical protein